MDQTQITKWTRRGIREPKPIDIGDDEIELMTLEGVNYLGMKIKAKEPSWFHKRTVLQSSTHVFSRPSDCVALLRLWDLGTTANTVTDATNASPINITSAAHGYADDAIVNVQDVGGNTAANDTWLITYVDANNFTLDGSTGNAVYTSGGICYAEPQSPIEITRKNLEEVDGISPHEWYPRGNKIVVDDHTFTNDLIVDYDRTPSAITDIPAVYHIGLVAFNIQHLIRIPQKEGNEAEFFDRIQQLKKATTLLETIERQIAATMLVSHEPITPVDTFGLRGELESM